MSLDYEGKWTSSPWSLFIKLQFEWCWIAQALENPYSCVGGTQLLTFSCSSCSLNVTSQCCLPLFLCHFTLWFFFFFYNFIWLMEHADWDTNSRSKVLANFCSFFSQMKWNMFASTFVHLYTCAYQALSPVEAERKHWTHLLASTFSSLKLSTYRELVLLL